MVPQRLSRGYTDTCDQIVAFTETIRRKYHEFQKSITIICIASRIDNHCNLPRARMRRSACRTRHSFAGLSQEEEMKKLMKISVLPLLAAIIGSGLVMDTSAQTRKRRPVVRKASTVKRAPAPRLYSVAAGKKIRVRMNDELSSKTAKVGDRFTTTVREPVYSTNGAIVIPEGSEIVGKVDSVTKAANKGKPGALDVSFVQVVLPNGTKRTISGSLTELNADDAKSDDEGTARGDRMKNRKLIWYGGGAAGGAILGAAVGGGKGALIGGLLGAGGGFLGERFTKGEEAKVESGTEFGIYLNRAVSLPKFAEANP